MCCLCISPHRSWRATHSTRCHMYGLCRISPTCSTTCHMYGLCSISPTYSTRCHMYGLCSISPHRSRRPTHSTTCHMYGLCSISPHRSRRPTYVTRCWWVSGLLRCNNNQLLHHNHMYILYSMLLERSWRRFMLVWVSLSVHSSSILRGASAQAQEVTHSQTSPPSPACTPDFPSQKTMHYHLTALCDWHPTGFYKSQAKLLFSQVLLEGMFSLGFFFFAYLHFVSNLKFQSGTL